MAELNVDAGCELEALYREEAIERVLMVVRSGKPSAEFCEGCGDPIPEARRLAVQGCQKCVACATRAEAARRGYSS